MRWSPRDASIVGALPSRPQPAQLTVAMALIAGAGVKAGDGNWAQSATNLKPPADIHFDPVGCAEFDQLSDRRRA